MNKRKSKKFEDKLFNKTYLSFRRAKIMAWGDKYCEKEHTDPKTTIFRIVDSKKMNLKQIKHVDVFTGCYPVAVPAQNDVEKPDADIMALSMPSFLNHCWTPDMVTAKVIEETKNKFMEVLNDARTN